MNRRKFLTTLAAGSVVTVAGCTQSPVAEEATNATLDHIETRQAGDTLNVTVVADLWVNCNVDYISRQNKMKIRFEATVDDETKQESRWSYTSKCFDRKQVSQSFLFNQISGDVSADVSLVEVTL